MKIFHSREEFDQEVILLHNEGNSIRALSRRFQIGRNAVRRIIRAHEIQRDEGHDQLKKRTKRKSLLDDGMQAVA